MDKCELGVNYKAQRANWDADIAYLKSVGVTCIRIHMPSLPTTWTSGGNPLTNGTFAYWRSAADYFHKAGFWVTWGASGLTSVASGQMTATLWAAYHDAVIAEAIYCQSQGIVLDCFELCNEIESTADGTTLTVDQMIINIGQLATDVKAVYPLALKVGYSPWDFANTTYDKWITHGLGGLDIINVHPYGNIATGARGIGYGGYTACLKMIYHFGADHCYVSEFGLEANDTNLQLMSDELQISTMKAFWAFIVNAGFKKAILYSFVGYLNGDDQFAMKWNDGHVEKMWDVVINDGKRTSSLTR